MTVTLLLLQRNCHYTVHALEQKMYSIEELAKRAGISKRTLHYYVKKGLLPSPGTRGTSTRYGQEYLDRLKVIIILKANYLPLDEIALLLGKLSKSEINRLSKASEGDLMDMLKIKDVRISSKSSKEAMQQEDASEYIEKVLDLSRSTRTPRKVLDRSQPNIPSPTSASSWERHRMTEGVELHVDSSIGKSKQSKVRKIIDFAIKLFDNRNASNVGSPK
jgi:DNA-binding transcriptional MerR regulator